MYVRTRLAIAALLAATVTIASGVAASTQEATTSPGSPSPVEVSIDVPQVTTAQDEQARVQHAKLLHHHARLVENRDRVQQASLDHQERTARQLGERAPKETIAPMATIRPIASAD